jgi:hypothetical protein|tara:strand:+ start:1911 stop:2303 length:393 start_codon:yes stop_codon:yes gene_type:complete
MKRSEAIELAVRQAYNALGVRPSNTRQKLHIQIRAAIGVALSSYCNTYEIGAALNRDRSSVSHYTTKHVQNLKYWEGYRDIYEIVSTEIEHNLQDHLLQLKIDTLNTRIDKLLAARQELMDRLNAEHETT